MPTESTTFEYYSNRKRVEDDESLAVVRSIASLNSRTSFPASLAASLALYTAQPSRCDLDLTGRWRLMRIDCILPCVYFSLNAQISNCLYLGERIMEMDQDFGKGLDFEIDDYPKEKNATMGGWEMIATYELMDPNPLLPLQRYLTISNDFYPYLTFPFISTSINPTKYSCFPQKTVFLFVFFVFSFFRFSFLFVCFFFEALQTRYSTVFQTFE